MSSGRAEVAKSRSSLRAAEQDVAHRPADQSDLVARVGEQCAEIADHRCARQQSGHAATPDVAATCGLGRGGGSRVRHGQPSY